MSVLRKLHFSWNKTPSLASFDLDQIEILVYALGSFRCVSTTVIEEKM